MFSFDDRQTYYQCIPDAVFMLRSFVWNFTTCSLSLWNLVSNKIFFFNPYTAPTFVSFIIVSNMILLSSIITFSYAIFFAREKRTFLTVWFSKVRKFAFLVLFCFFFCQKNIFQKSFSGRINFSKIIRKLHIYS